MENRVINIEKLIEKWTEVLSEGQEIKNPKVKKATALMLENQHNHLMEASNSSSYGQGSMDPMAAGYPGNAMFHKIAVPMVRRTFPELIAHEIVGVQPMTGPVGLAFALRFRGDTTYGGTTYSQHGTYTDEVGYNTVNNAYSGTGTSPSGTGFVVTSGEALGSKAGSGVGNDIGLGIGTGQHIKEVAMTIEKAQVEARTRKLRSRWSLEVAQDIKAMHGLDLEDEMMDVLAYEITAEIDRELITNISTVAPVDRWDFDDTNDADGRWEIEKYRNTPLP